MGRKTEITNLLANLPRLGAGLSYRRPFRGELLQKQSEVDFIEIIGDTYLDAPLERRLKTMADEVRKAAPDVAALFDRLVERLERAIAQGAGRRDLHRLPKA